MRRSADPDPPIDWTLTTWEGSRREQLRRWAALPLDRVIAALEEMAELAETLERPATSATAGDASPEDAPLNDQLAVLHLVAARLDDLGIHYMVSGSTAMNYYAQPRMTRDIDVVVELNAGSVERFTDAFAEDFYCDRDAIRTAVDRREIFNLIHLERLVKVDVVVRKDTPYRRQEFARRRRVTVDGEVVWLVSSEDLLLSKLVWAKDSLSEVQLGDARNLLASVPNLDQTYLERWAAELAITELLEDVRR